MKFPFFVKENKYYRWYIQLVEKRKASPLTTTYTESHHIIPKSLGGSNELENQVRLSAREHYIAHLLLVKMDMPEVYHKKMLYAYHMMATMNNGRKRNRAKQPMGVAYKVSGRVYETFKKERSDDLSSRMRQLFIDNPKHPLFVRTENQKKKISESTKKRHLDPVFRSQYEAMLKRRVLATSEVTSRTTKEGMAKPEARARYLAGIAKRVLNQTPESIAKTKATKIAKYGENAFRISEETKKKISSRLKGKKLTPEHCAAMSVGNKASYAAGRTPWNKGKTSLKKHTDETRRRMSESHQRRKLLGIKRAKSSVPYKKHPEVTCPHCQKIGRGNSMTRWHFDNCKYKDIGTLPI